MKKESNVKVYEINKRVSDRFGFSVYLAEFVTDNKLFTKCTLVVGGDIVSKYTDKRERLKYVSVIKCYPEDTFNSYVGHSMAIERCLDKFNKYITKQNFGDVIQTPYTKPRVTGNKKRSRWESYQKHLSIIADRFDKTLAKVCTDFKGVME